MAASEIFMLNTWVKKKKIWVIFSSNLNDRYCYMFFFFLKYVIFWCTKIFFLYVKYEKITWHDLPSKIRNRIYSYHCKYYYLLHVFHPLPTPIPMINIILVCWFLMYLKLCHDFFVAMYFFIQLIHSFLLVLNWLYIVVFIPLLHIFKTLFLKVIYSILYPLIILIILYFKINFNQV